MYGEGIRNTRAEYPTPIEKEEFSLPLEEDNIITKDVVLMKKYESGPQVCEDYSGKPLGVGSVSAAFAIIILAMLLVLVIFGLEFVFFIIASRKIRKVVNK